MTAQGWFASGDGLFIGPIKGRRRPALYHRTGDKTVVLARFDSDLQAFATSQLLRKLIGTNAIFRPAATNVKASELSELELADLDRYIGMTD